jgi:hypothetical protein
MVLLEQTLNRDDKLDFNQRAVAPGYDHFHRLSSLVSEDQVEGRFGAPAPRRTIALTATDF